MPAPIEIPRQFESERLVIRAVDPCFADAVHEAIAESFAELKPWLPWAQQVPSLEEQRAEMVAAAQRFAAGEDLRMLLFRRADDCFVGASGLHSINWDARRFEIGYWARTSCRGNGYITEAALAIGEFAFREFHAERVEIWVSSANTASLRVAERAGYPREAVLRRHRRDPNGLIADSVVFARLRGE